MHLTLLKHIFRKINYRFFSYIVLTGLVVTTAIGVGLYAKFQYRSQAKEKELQSVTTHLDSSLKAIDKMKKEDQRVRNDKLQKEIEAIEKTYGDAVSVYEQLADLRVKNAKISDLDESYAKIISYLSKRNYASASAQLVLLKKDIQTTLAQLNAPPAGVTTQNLAQSNTPPSGGYNRQLVKTDVGSFAVDIISADLNSAKVVVDTASDGTCGNDCPVMSVGQYAGRSGAFAAINGPYFCPASYPSCAGKTNSFDTLLMNKNKIYFNSDNNVYSTVPAAIFMSGGSRFVGQSLEWGRDTNVDAVIANQPALVLGGNIVFGGDDEIKRSGRGSRSFIGGTGSMAYMGIVYNANVAEVAVVVHTMGIQNAINLDSGGSTALWSNGTYLAGPGRDLPFAILFVGR